MSAMADLLQRIQAEGLLVLEPRETFDRAIVGVTDGRPNDSWNRATDRACVQYSERACIAALVDVEGWDYDEARDWFDCNIECAWVGEGTPTFVE